MDNTKRIARIIANHIGVALYELEPVNSYTSADLNYNNASSRVIDEHNDPNRHIAQEKVKKMSLNGLIV